MRQSINSNNSGKLNYSKLYHSLSRSNKVKLPSDDISIGNSQQIQDGRSFSSQSRQDVMQRNLKSGLEYIDKQRENLSEIGNIIDTWRFSMERETRERRHFAFNHLRNVIYIDPITKLVEERFHNRLLFGDGSESAIRIHLMIEGRRHEFHLKVVPLLIDPGFQAVMHSGSSNDYPSGPVFDQCCTHIINCMLNIEHNRADLNEMYSIVSSAKQQNNNITALNPTNSIPAIPMNSSQTRKAVLERIISFLITKFPITSMAGILLPLSLLKKF
jgi:hypothetical protein